ncbi:MAG: site-specific integrase [Longimicrobiales bacterium]|nr:site-specific integrase [Longimicrobiales bacterium]
MDEGAANATIQKETAALKRAFRLAKQANRLPHIPHVPVPATDNVRTHFLTMADVHAVAGHIGPDLAPVVRFAAMTGWRKGEVLNLQWSEVDFNAGTIRLLPGTTKNNEGRTFPMAALPPLVELMERQRAHTREIERETGEIITHVFHRDGQPIRHMRYNWNRAAKMAGLEGAWFHDLRRTAVKNLEKAGVSRSVAMKLTGHKTESVYRRYAIADEVALTEGVEKLARLHQDGTEGRSIVPIDTARQA